MIIKIVTLVLLVCVSLSSTQDTAQPRIAPHLRRCYQNRNIFERDNRLPMTPVMFIELIRKVESSPGFSLNMRNLALSIIFRFKQDGILPSNFGNQQPDILPFAVNGFNFHKHRVLLTRLLTGNQNMFPNGTLTEWEECTLHFMLSTSLEMHVRGDEGQRCTQLSQLRSIRVPRDVSEDVEMLKTPEMANVRKRLHQKFGRYQEDEETPEEQNDELPTENDEQLDEENELLTGEEQQGQVGTVSQCPVENGVIHSPWGSVSIGTTLAGIAAGLAPQTVPVQQLIDDDHVGHYRLARQTAGNTVDNRYAATLSGDIAEAVLRQSPNTIQVGAGGGWNNTAVPHWYFLSQRDRLEHTDAEIRAGIDGLLLGLRIFEWHRQLESLRLSQVLDMYYSQRGMFGAQSTPGSDNSIRACNRRNMFSTIQMAILRQQSIAFTTVLDGEMQTQITLTPNSTQRIATQATDALQEYIANRLNDLPCAGTETNVGSSTIWRTASDIYIYVDTTWPFIQIRAMIAHLLNNLDVGRFGTTYTILNAFDGTVLVRTTNQLSDFYTEWNQTIHEMHPGGLNLANIVRETRNYMQSFLNMEREQQRSGGRSLINLIVVDSATVSEGDSNFAAEQIQIMREDVPDLRWIFWASGSPNRFERFVREPARDLFPLRIDLNGIGGDSIQSVAHFVIHRIQQEPRRVINHRCGADWPRDNWGDINLVEFIEPRGIAFYRVHPNYFFGFSDQQFIRIAGGGFSTITVCHSRTVERPRANLTNNEHQQGEVTCQNVNTDTVEINLGNACGGHGVIHWCPPLFISVEGPAQHDGVNMRCTENECRFPDNSRFQIMGQNLGCWNGVGKITGSILIFLVSLFLTLGL